MPYNDDPDHNIRLQELSQALLIGLTAYARRGLGQSIDALIFAALMHGVDFRYLASRLTQLRSGGFIPSFRSTRHKAVKESHQRAEAALREAATAHLNS